MPHMNARAPEPPSGDGAGEIAPPEYRPIPYAMLKTNERVEQALLQDLTDIDQKLANELSQEGKMWMLRTRGFIIASLDLLMYCNRARIKVSAYDLLKINALDGLVLTAMESQLGRDAARGMLSYLKAVPAYRDEAIGRQSEICAEKHITLTLAAQQLFQVFEMEKTERRSKISVPLLLALISGAMMSFGLFTDPSSETVLQALERDPSTFLTAMAGTLGLSVAMIWAEQRSRREKGLMPLGRAVHLMVAKALRNEGGPDQGAHKA